MVLRLPDQPTKRPKADRSHFSLCLCAGFPGLYCNADHDSTMSLGHPRRCLRARGAGGHAGRAD